MEKSFEVRMDMDALVSDSLQLNGTALVNNIKGKNGSLFQRFFTVEGQDPFSTVAWEFRDVTITQPSGEIVFEQRGVESPASWSQTAVSIVASKYFTELPGSGRREDSIRALISRIVSALSAAGEEQGYFKEGDERRVFEDELVYILLHQYASFNSPVWFNLGVNATPQCSACFILSVDDTMESLLQLQQTEGMLFKYGSGAGSNLSSIRSTKEKLAGGGTPSGPVSFMKGFDAWANIIKSGGKTRRAAKMQILNMDHPDIVEFINCKKIEEEKAWKLLDAGFGPQAYDSAAFQNANLSVRVDDAFMKAVESDTLYATRSITKGEVCEELQARSLLRQVAEGTWVCGDPGIQFDTTINRWHTCPNSGRINASNPCSEYMHLDNSACNLASINLLKLLNDEGNFEVDAFRHTVHVLLSGQDMLIDASSYPTPAIQQCARDYRQLGIGYANLGALLMSKGLPYDSDGGRAYAGSVTALMTGQAYFTSALLSERRGPFVGYEKNRKPMNEVIRMHQRSLGVLKNAPKDIIDSAYDAWDDAVKTGEAKGYRNSQVSVLAPTGTISFMMDCDTTGVEPDIALVKYKRLAGGGTLKLVNRTVERGLEALGYSDKEIRPILDYIREKDTIEGAPGLKNEHLPVFDCALRPINGLRHISYSGHLKMMAAVQPFISGAISKTVNLPKEVTVEEIMNVYIDAWKHGLKSVALYRDGSKRFQPLSMDKGDASAKALPHPVRRRLPDERKAVTHKFSVGGLEGYITVGIYDDGLPGEVFLVVAKEGSTLSGVMDAFATSVSIALQYGVPLKALVKKFTHSRFEPSGFTGNKEIPIAKSIIDYVFKWLALKFLSPEECLEVGVEKRGGAGSSHGHHVHESEAETTFVNMEDAPPCTACGSSLMVRQGGCYVCLNCGSQGGCG